ncbi:MAG: ATP-binding protein [Rectinemataceae bacterium]
MKPLVVPARLDSLQDIRKYVQTAAAEAGLDKKDAYRLALAVDEVTTNIVTHGYAEVGREGTVGVRADPDENHLTIALEDTGVAFDPTVFPEPDILKPVAERNEGGMGIYLALKGVDGFRYERVGSINRNIFVMNKKSLPTREP